MAAFDANLGVTQANTGSATTLALTTTAAAAASTRIVVFAHNFGTATPASCAVGGGSTVTFVRDLLIDDADNTTGAFFSADAPTGLASGFVITVTWSAAADARGVSAMSFTGLTGGSSGYLTGTPAFTSAQFGGTSWATPNITTGSGVIVAGVYADGAAAATGGVTAPATEVHKSWNSTTTAELITGYRIVTPATYSIAGTFGTAPSEQRYAIVGYLDGGGVVAAPKPYIPHRMPQGV